MVSLSLKISSRKTFRRFSLQKLLKDKLIKRSKI
jgi:hypothetical protein